MKESDDCLLNQMIKLTNHGMPWHPGHEMWSVQFEECSTVWSILAKNVYVQWSLELHYPILPYVAIEQNWDEASLTWDVPQCKILDFEDFR